MASAGIFAGTFALLMLFTPPAHADTPLFSGEAALQAATDVVRIGPRASGTPGAERAATHIANRLRTTGVQPHIDTFQEQTRTGAVTFRNVTATITGRTSNATIVLVSHYDTKGGIAADFVGANDSGSSTGLLLALAPALMASPFESDILLAFVDGEECVTRYGETDGLHGSRRLVHQLGTPGAPRRTAAVIVVDMIGDRDLTVTIPSNGSPQLIRLALDAADAIGARKHFALERRAILDDHVPFLDAGLPAVDLIDFEYGSRPGRNNYWHTAADTLDKLSAASLEIVGRVVLEMIARLDKKPHQGGKEE